MNIFTIYGSPGSGKTTLAVKLASRLSQSKKKNCGVLFAGMTPSPLSYVFPSLSERDIPSIGFNLSKENMSEDDLFSTLISPSQNSYLCFAGYSCFDTPGSYPETDIKRCKQFIKLFSENVDYLFIDASSDIHSSILSQAAMLTPSEKICVVSRNIKGCAWVNSCRTNVSSAPSDETVVLSDTSGFDTELSLEYRNVEYKHKYVFPYSTDIYTQYQSGKLLDRNSAKTESSLESMIQMVEQYGQQIS
jgi:RecA/RadA recombinase